MQFVGAFLRPTIDVPVAVMGLSVVAPALTVFTLATWLRMGRPVFFRRAHSGYRAKPFTLYKIHTIRKAYGADCAPLNDLLFPFSRDRGGCAQPVITRVIFPPEPVS